MATLYWVGSGTNWSSTSSWSTTSGGASGSGPPTAADDVIFDSNSGNATIDVAATCRSLDCTAGTGNYASTLTHAAGVNLVVGTTTVPASNVALKFVAGMTYTLGNAATSGLVFSTVNATQLSITTAGKTIGNLTFNSAGSWLSDAITATGGTITLQAGTWATGGNNVTASTINWGPSGAVTRTFTPGSSYIHILGNSASNGLPTVGTNLAVTANTATLLLDASNAQIAPGNQNWNGLSLVFAGATTNTLGSTAGTPTFGNLVRVSTAEKQDFFTIFCSPTVTGTLALQGNSAINRLMVNSSVLGTQRTITVNGSVTAAVTLNGVTYQTQYCDLQDIKAGNLGDISGNIQPGNTSPILSGDAGGNTGWTFTPSQDQYRIGAGGNWSDSTAWSQTSGGSNNGRIPLSQDNVHVDNNATGTIIEDMVRMGASIDFTGFAGTCSFNSITGTAGTSFYGNWTFSSTMTVASLALMIAGGRGNQTIQHNGKAWPNSITFSSVTGTYTLLDNCMVGSSGTSNFNPTAGSVVTNGYSVACGQFLVQPTATSVDITNSTITCGVTSSGGGYNFFSIGSAGTTFTSTGSTIVLRAQNIGRTSAGFAGLGKTFATLSYTAPASPAPLIISGANTFGTINVGGGPRTITFPSSTTTTITSSFNVNGALTSGYLYLAGPTTANDNVQTPDNPGLRLTGDLDIRVYAALDAWTPTANEFALIGKYSGNGASSEAWLLTITTAGKLRFRYSNGTTVPSYDSTLATGLSAGAQQWVRVTWQQSTQIVTYYLSSDGVTWNPLGTASSNIGAYTLNTTDAQPIVIGATAQGDTFNTPGKFYKAQVLNGIGGSAVASPDFTTTSIGSETTYTDQQDNLWTVNGVANNLVYVNSSTAGTKATLSVASGTVTSNFVSLKDITTTGGATFNMANGQVVSNVSGWNVAQHIRYNALLYRSAAPARSTASGRSLASGRSQI